MREVTVYYSYDDEEFYDRAECEEYEERAYNLLVGISEKYTFFDEKYACMCPPVQTSEVEELIKFFDEIFSSCFIVRRIENLTTEENHFLQDEFDYYGLSNDDFNNELGIFKYNYDSDRWEKVGE